MGLGTERMELAEPVPAHAPEDGDLVRLFVRQGDRAAMGTLFSRHADAAYRLALRLCRNAADAEDAVQTAFVQVMRRAANYRGDAAVKAWILGFVINACRQKSREEGRRRAREDRAAGDREPAAPPPAAESAELAGAVRRAVSELPEPYRAPLWLCYGEGLSSVEASAALDVPEGTIRSQLLRGLEKLRDALATSGLAVGAAALTGALAEAACEAAPASLKTSLAGLAADGAPAVAAAVKTGLVARLTAGTVAAAALATTAAALWRASPESAPPPNDLSWIEERVREWQPTPEERRFDDVAWAKDIPTALELARAGGRPVFVLAHVGHVNAGRSDGGSLNFRGHVLADPEVRRLLNTRFVPVYVSTDSGPNPERDRIYREALAAKLGAGSEHLYFLDPAGRVVDSMYVCKTDARNLLERLQKHAGPAGAPAVTAGPQLPPPPAPPGGLVLHVTARYLDEHGKLESKRASYHEFPAEEWIVLGPDEVARLAAPGDVEPALAEKLLRPFYPLTGNFDPPSKNRVVSLSLHATRVSDRRVRLDGRLQMVHPYYPGRDERLAEATVAGFLDSDAGLRMVTASATYGRENFGVAVRSQ
jgi:RNA polymerase sigma-70 factor (ECF subfamily)